MLTSVSFNKRLPSGARPPRGPTENPRIGGLGLQQLKKL